MHRCKKIKDVEFKVKTRTKLSVRPDWEQIAQSASSWYCHTVTNVDEQNELLMLDG